MHNIFVIWLNIQSILLQRVEEYKHGRSQMSPKEKAEIARDLPAVLNKTASQYTKDEIVQ